VIDALVLLGENRFGPTLEVEATLELCRQLGVGRVVAAPARPLDYHLEPANEWLAREAAARPGQLFALGRVDPLDGTRAVNLARRCLAELGCVGLFLHPAEEAFPVLRAGPILEAAREHGAPVVVATGYFALSEPLQVAQLAQDFPDVPILMTTGGQINISGLSMVDAWLALKGHPNLRVATNGEYRQDFIERLVADLGAERVLYASFAPSFDLAFEVRRIRAARMSDFARRLVEEENAVRLFRLPPRGPDRT
jgi:predicted TIM-barrel fold metal-dependent hydrolase